MTEINDLIEPDFQVPDNFPIARVQSVILKQIDQGDLITQTGLILPTPVSGNASNGGNSNRPKVGIIYSVGSGCKPDLVPGIRVFYNQYCDSEVLLDGRPYVMMSELDVLCILKPKNYVKIAVKDAREVRLIKKHAEQESYLDRKFKVEQNAKDKKVETKKKK